MLPLQRYPTLAILLVCAINFPPPSSGLECSQCEEGQCHSNVTTCEPAPGGVCYAVLRGDISGIHWSLRLGCSNDPESYLCKYSSSDTHRHKCCSDRNNCNKNLLEPPFIKCNCIGDNCDNGDEKHCTLKSSKYSCYTLLNREAGYVVHQKGCKKNCEDIRTNDVIRICCNSTKCNNEATHVWPSEEPPTTSDPKPPTTTTTTRKPGEILCHCSGCVPDKRCSTPVGCLRVTIGSQQMTSCAGDIASCNNDSSEFTRFSNSTPFVDVMCCTIGDDCNDPTKPTKPTKPTEGPPCDDEDVEDEQSGGCGFGPVMSSTVSPSRTTITTSSSSTSTTNFVKTASAKATPTSSKEATPTKGITEESEEDDDSQIMLVFYIFTVLLTICIVIMIVIIAVCVGLVCHYKGMAYNTVLSSATILESALKEKGYRTNNNISPI